MNFYENKNVLVTGAGGFIGSHLVDELIEKKVNVYALIKDIDSPTKNIDHIKNKINILYSDMGSIEECLRITKNIDIVMNLAAKFGGIHYNTKRPGSLLTANIIPFSNILEASRINNVGRFLTVSSACVYPKECTIPIHESEAFNGLPEEENKGYGWAKRFQEIASINYHQEYGMKIAITRLYNVYGPRSNFDPQFSNVIPGLIKRMDENENPFMIWGGGQQTRSFMYVKDVCKAFLEITEKKSDADPINLGSDEEVKIIDLIKYIADIMNKKPEYKIDQNKPTGHMRRIADVSKAKTTIDYSKMMPLKTGLEKTIEWYIKSVER